MTKFSRYQTGQLKNIENCLRRKNLK